MNKHGSFIGGVYIVIHTDQHLTQHCTAKRQSQVHRANEPMLLSTTLAQHQNSIGSMYCVCLGNSMSLNQIYCVSWISVALSVTLLYKNREKCYIVIVQVCYRAVVP